MFFILLGDIFRIRISKCNSEYSRLDYDFMLTNMIFYMQNLDINYKICIFAVL